MENSLNNKELRKQYKNIRDNISSLQREEKSRAITDNILALLESDFKGANIFLCFYPFGSEVNLLPLYEKLLKEDKDVYFPVSDINNHELSFYKVSDLQSDFNKGSYGIMEPFDTLPILNQFDNIVVITPGLIFDNNGNRIGYGAGFYDRFFAKHSTVKKIGVAFEEQVIDKLDVKEHDVPLDYIVTNNRLIKRGI